MRGPDIVGREALESKSPYRHAFEHRGHGVVAIYSYGPLDQHDRIVRSAAQLMSKRFGVSGAISSGGISGWPEDEHYNGPADGRTIETQTIFCIDAVSGPNRSKLRPVAPARADWHLNYVLDAGQDYLGDGDVDEFFTGPLEDEETWRAKVEEMTGGEGTIVEATVRAVQQGRYWFLADGDPIAEWRD